MIDTLSEFTVAPEYHRDRTLYHVRRKDSDLVAQLRADAPVRNLRNGLQVFTGPALDQPAGWVSWTEAKTPDGVPVGTIGRQNRGSRKESWIFAQADLPELSGELSGATGVLRNNWVLRDALSDNLVGGTIPLRLRFRGSGCAGFEINRSPGMRAKYRVRIHDERISRLLVLACVVRYNVGHDIDPRKDIIRLTTSPFK